MACGWPVGWERVTSIDACAVRPACRMCIDMHSMHMHMVHMHASVLVKGPGVKFATIFVVLSCKRLLTWRNYRQNDSASHGGVRRNPGGGGHASMTKTTWSLIWTVQQRKMPLAAQLGRRKRHPPTSKCQRGGLLRVSSSRSLNTLRCGWPVRRPLSASAPARHARAASAHHQGRRRCSHRRMFRR